MNFYLLPSFDLDGILKEVSGLARKGIHVFTATQALKTLAGHQKPENDIQSDYTPLDPLGVSMQMEIQVLQVKAQIGAMFT